MSFKTTFQKNLKEKKEIIGFKYTASKMMFIFTTFSFFLSFFMTGAGYYENITKFLVSPLYIMLIFSSNLYVYFFMRKKFFEKKMLLYIVMGVFFVFSLFALLIIIK